MKVTKQLDPNRMPDHVAIIMDGNGRWAKARHKPRIFGHKNGMRAIVPVVTEAVKLHIKVLTLYAFSTENWKRPAKEVNYIMSLPQTFFSQFMPKLVRNNVRVRIMGYRLPPKTQQVADLAVKETRHCTGLILNIAFNYGGRDEIVTAAKQLAQEVKTGSIDVNDITNQTFAKHLMTGSLNSLADPDLLIRTGGELRISNFLLWQMAYTEFVFRKEYWPDFTPQTLIDSVYEYQHRQRRFGGLK